MGSPLASEGSRTGFYTDEYDQQWYKAPEEIRKANLRGADLRGAKIEGFDFYLVDLRDANTTTTRPIIFVAAGRSCSSAPPVDSRCRASPGNAPPTWLRRENRDGAGDSRSAASRRADASTPVRFKREPGNKRWLGRAVLGCEICDRFRSNWNRRFGRFFVPRSDAAAPCFNPNGVTALAQGWPAPVAYPGFEGQQILFLHNPNGVAARADMRRQPQPR